MDDIILIQIWNKATGKYEKFITPSDFGFDTEDLDNKSYRSKNSGNVIRTRINPDWAKIKVKYNFVSHEDMKTYYPKLRPKEIKMKIFIPIFGNDYEEYEVYVAKKSGNLLEQKSGWELSFNIVQAKWISGQVN